MEDSGGSNLEITHLHAHSDLHSSAHQRGPADVVISPRSLMILAAIIGGIVLLIQL